VQQGKAADQELHRTRGRRQQRQVQQKFGQEGSEQATNQQEVSKKHLHHQEWRQQQQQQQQQQETQAACTRLPRSPSNHCKDAPFLSQRPSAPPATTTQLFDQSLPIADDTHDYNRKDPQPTSTTADQHLTEEHQQQQQRKRKEQSRMSVEQDQLRDQPEQHQHRTVQPACTSLHPSLSAHQGVIEQAPQQRKKLEAQLKEQQQEKKHEREAAAANKKQQQPQQGARCSLTAGLAKAAATAPAPAPQQQPVSDQFRFETNSVSEGHLCQRG
jgi:hypothetical protein